MKCELFHPIEDDPKIRYLLYLQTNTQFSWRLFMLMTNV